MGWTFGPVGDLPPVTFWREGHRVQADADGNNVAWTCDGPGCARPLLFTYLSGRRGSAVARPAICPGCQAAFCLAPEYTSDTGQADSVQPAPRMFIVRVAPSATRGSELPASGAWDMSQERAFLENLVGTRFNFLLVLFSVIVAAAAASSGVAWQASILGGGAVLCALVALTVYRAHVKLDQTLKLLHATPEHPVAVIGARVDALGRRGLFRVTQLVGCVIPLVCTLSLLAGCVLVLALSQGVTEGEGSGKVGEEPIKHVLPTDGEGKSTDVPAPK